MRSILMIASALVLIVAGSLSLPARSAPEQTAVETDLAGTYSCEGTRPDGAAYRGVVEIVRHEGTYQLLWTLSPEEKHLGIGIAKGDVLAVSYFGGLPGVILYGVEKGDGGPRLVGRWTVLGADGRVFNETLTRVPKGAPQPPAPEPARPRRAPSRARPV